MKTYGGTCGNEPGLIKAQMITQGVVAADLNDPKGPIKKKKALAVCRKGYQLCMLLQGLDNTRFYQLKIIANSMAMGQDQFPKTMVETQPLLNDYKMPPRQQHVKELDSNGVVLVQNRRNPAPPLIGSIKTWHCGKKGHYKSNCPELQVQELDVGMLPVLYGKQCSYPLL